MAKDSLATRMKGYESISKIFLIRKRPVIVRLDGKSFHTFTRGFKKPFDEVIIYTMQETMRYLCKNIQGCVLGYTQSDEITLILCDYQKPNTDAWFGYSVQKITSVAASLATFAFNKTFNDHVSLHYEPVSPYRKAAEQGAIFDARAFNLPIEEVNNLLVWRQQDAIRNSVQALSQSLFSHRELQGKSCDELKEKMFVEKDVDWYSIPSVKKYGACCIKKTNIKLKQEWEIDDTIPIFHRNPNYVNNLITFENN